MVHMIKTDAHLVPYLREQIEDAGLSVDIDPSLTNDDFATIKVDDYYAQFKNELTPKIVDYVVVVDCQCSAYAMYILELKNVNSPYFLDIPAIQEKFDNTITDFLSNRFAYIFTNDRFKYKSIKLYMVSDAYQKAGTFQNHAEYLAFREKINKKDSLKVDLALRQKLFRFRGKILQIEYDMPPNPVISRIY